MKDSTTWWQDFRRQMPAAGRWAYFDHAAVAPLSGPAGDAIREWLDAAVRDGEVAWPAWRKIVEEARRLAAEMLHAERDEIALIRNTTEGISLVAEGFPWQAGDNVVVPACEFPSNLYPWMNLATRGVEVRRVDAPDERLDLDRLDAACDERTRIVSASWVGYATGWRNDVAVIGEIAHRHGALFFLDAIQGMGVLPLDVSRAPVDCLAADGHKWLLGPEGAGLLYVRREHLDRLRPLGVGWNSVRQAGEFAQTELDLKPSAARYEGGSYNMAGIAGLAASLKLLHDYGIDSIAARVLEVTDTLCERLQSIGAEVASDRTVERRSGIVAFTLPGRDPFHVKRRCLERHVVVNCRVGRLRVSPHAYVDDDEDVKRLLAAIHETSS